MNNVEMFKSITDEMVRIYEAKNHDYGDSVHDTYVDFGLVSFLVRMQDKMNRLKKLSKDDAKVLDEKIEDTLLDLANYSIIALMELKKEKNNEN